MELKRLWVLRFVSMTVIFHVGVLLAQEPQPLVLSKREAYDLMKKNGFRWQQTKLLVPEAEAQNQEAHSALEPHIQVVAREFVGRVNQLQFGFSNPGNLEVFTLGSSMFQAGFNLIDQASVARAQAASTNVKIGFEMQKQYQNDLTYLLVVQFLNSQRLKKKIDVILANIERDNNIFLLAQAKVRSGLGVSIDLMRAKGLIQIDTLKKLDAEISYKKSLSDLALLLGLTDLPKDLEPLRFEEMSGADSQLTRTDALQLRPDLNAAKYTVEASRSLKVMSEKERMPKVGLFGEVGVVGTHVVGGFGNAVTGMVGVQITMPVFDGGYNSSKIQEAVIKVSKAEIQVSQIQVESESQVKTALSQLSATRVAVDVSNTQVDIANEELRLANKRFSFGAASGLELTSAQTSIANALDSNVEAVFAYEVSKANYFKAIGNFEKYFTASKAGP